MGMIRYLLAALLVAGCADSSRDGYSRIHVSVPVRALPDDYGDRLRARAVAQLAGEWRVVQAIDEGVTTMWSGSARSFNGVGSRRNEEYERRHPLPIRMSMPDATYLFTRGGEFITRIPEPDPSGLKQAYMASYYAGDAPFAPDSIISRLPSFGG